MRISVFKFSPFPKEVFFSRRKAQDVDGKGQLQEFYKFNCCLCSSWHEMGHYDIPATIDYIMDITGEKLYYIGHSMGATMLFVMTSSRPEYNAKLRLAFALAPAAFLWKPSHQFLKAIIPSSKQIAVCSLANVCVCVCVCVCARARAHARSYFNEIIL
jgi:predicted alpha/beta hydrolase